MSPLVTRPSLPEPGTVAASMPLSVESFRTDGASGASDAAAFGAAAGAAAAAAAALAGAAAGFAALAAPSLICPSSAPTATVSPSLAAISPSTPADGAGTSMVTLSVSSSTNGSSTATASPAFLNQRPMVASVTDSPSVGTRISVMVFFLNNLKRSQIPRRHRPPCARLRTGRTIQYAGTVAIEFQRRGVLDAPLARGMTNGDFLVQRLIQHRLELRLVLRHQTGGGCGRGGAARVTRTPVRRMDLVQHPFEIGLDEVP